MNVLSKDVQVQLRKTNSVQDKRRQDMKKDEKPAPAVKDVKPDGPSVDAMTGFLPEGAIMDLFRSEYSQDCGLF
jgi:hypothetical protein